MTQIEFSAVLMALLLSLLPALWTGEHFSVIRQFWREWRTVARDFLAEDLGVSVAYYARNGSGGLTVLGATTPLTASQAATVPTIKAVIGLVDADTQALFTHNWGLDASAPGYYEPEIFAYLLLAGPLTVTFQPNLTFDVTNTNVIKVNKANLAGSAGTWVITARKPHSTGQ